MVQEAITVTAASSMQQTAVPPSVASAYPLHGQRSGSIQRSVEAPSEPIPKPFTAYARLQDVKDGLQNAAVGDRQRLVEAERRRELARQMQANLMAIVKNYPPFPPESEERRHYLELAIGLRKQMEALIVPPPDEGGPPALAAGSRTALEGLNLASSDAEIAMAAQALAELQTGLAGYGEEIRAAWRASEPMAQEDARRLSAEAAALLAGSSSGIGTAARL